VTASALPHVTIYYKMYLTGGHHRQPRNASAELNLAPQAGGDVPTGGSTSPAFFPQLPYTYSGGSGMATLEFWSVTDGTNGQVLPPTAINQTVGSLPLTITAWYFPTGGSPGPTEIIDDAFSANLGQFIDDTFVDVTSDPGLTSEANVVGLVPTSTAETLVARNAVISTPEPFYKWVLNGAFMLAGDRTLHVAKDTVGIAVAIYQQSQTSLGIPPNISAYNPWWWIETHGGLVPPGPVDPWARDLAAALSLAGTAGQASPQQRARLLEAALQQIRVAASSLEKQIQGAQEK
jgi:hypothetical protein